MIHAIRRTCTSLVALTLLASAPSHAQESSSTLEPLDVATMRYVRSAHIAPDGGHVAYVLGVPRTPRDEEDGSTRSQLHVLDWNTSRSRAFVTAESGVSGVEWTADSSGIGFLAKRDGDDHRSLYVIPADGGEAGRVLQLEDRGISQFTFAPDGRHVALVATPPVPKDREKAEKKGFKPEVYEEHWRPGEIWVATLEDAASGLEVGEPRRIPLDAHVSGIEWSPNGRSIAAHVAPTALVDDSYVEKRVWVVDAATGDVTARIANRGKLGGIAWSKGGDAIAMIAAFDEHDGSAARLLVANLEAPDKQAIAPQPVLGVRERDEHQVVSIGPDTMLVRGSEGAWSTLDAYTFVDGKAAARRPLLPLEGPVWTSMTVSSDGKRIALVGSTPAHPPELYTLELDTRELKRRTTSNAELASVSLARQEIISYPARDGLRVEGVLIHPLDGARPAPLIVCVHGGPEAHQSNGWLTRYAYPGQVGAARGYAIFYPNYRGSTGRGLAFLKASQGDPAGKEFDDVVDGVDYLIAQGIADPERVGVTGGSYGGYATAWMSTYYSERFAAGVMMVGISNKISKVGTTDIADEEFFVHAMKRPWDDWQFFLERSPIFHADKGQTPLLILHGKDDTRVDPGQSREMYRHLKLRGKAPVRLVNYPGEGHGNRKAGARFDYNLRMLRWFDHYLMGEGGEPPAWELDYDAHLPKKEEKAEGDGV